MSRIKVRNFYCLSPPERICVSARKENERILKIEWGRSAHTYVRNQQMSNLLRFCGANKTHMRFPYAKIGIGQERFRTLRGPGINPRTSRDAGVKLRAYGGCLGMRRR